MKTLARLALACSGALLALSASATEPFSFGLFGDTPYNRFERLALPGLIAEMNAEPLKFVLHDGDIKNGGERCDDALFEDRLQLFQTSFHPLVFAFGDNEWTDCHRSNNGGYDPLERLAALRRLFFAEPGWTLGQNPMKVESQASMPEHATYRENLRWQIGPVLFLSLNVPGSDNNYGRGNQPSDEFMQRSAALKAWIADGFALARSRGLEGVMLAMQANPDIEDFSQGKANKGYRALLEQILAETKRFPGEVLLVHGDTHFQRVDKPLRDPANGDVVKNFTRLETFGSPFMGWVKVDVEPGRLPLFRYTVLPYTPARADNSR
ncbi:MAG: hypothetical protein JSS57_01000 [Proteobacteria bacterium]|nr:hypothetical protein [Pseudomonadota bacterium]